MWYLRTRKQCRFSVIADELLYGVWMAWWLFEYVCHGMVVWVGTSIESRVVEKMIQKANHRLSLFVGPSVVWKRHDGTTSRKQLQVLVSL